MFSTNFSMLDWGIVVVYLSTSLIIGLLVNRYVSRLSDYLLGGRATGTSLSIATYIGTGLGLVTVMYASIEAFNRGFSYIFLAVIGTVVGMFVGGTGFVIKRLRELKLLTIPQYYGQRFDKRTRVTAGFICALAGILNMGLFPKMGATFLTYATGLAAGGTDHTFMVNSVTSILIVLVLAYTVLGGMVAVIVTDYIQFVVLTVGMALGLYFCFNHPDLSFESVMNIQATARGEKAFNPFHSDSYGWMYMLWMILTFLLAAVCWAPEATRALTTKDTETTKRTFLFSAPGQFIRLAIPAIWAIAAFAYFSGNSESLSYFFPNGLGGEVANAEQAMPLFLGKIIPSGLLGLLVAGLLAAFMSTHDSYFLCWASVIINDVVAPLKKKALTELEQIRLTRISVVLIGIFLLAWGIWYELPKSIWTYMAVTGTVYLSGSATVLIGGIYWPGASSTGAFAALLGGLISIAGLFSESLGALIPWLTPAVLGIGNYIFCMVLFIIFSLLFPDTRKVT